LGAGVTIQPCRKIIVEKPKKGGQGPNWAVESYDEALLERSDVRRKIFQKIFRNIFPENFPFLKIITYVFLQPLSCGFGLVRGCYTYRHSTQLL
jgi:hypothetical protein